MVYTKQQEANYRALYGKMPPSSKKGSARSMPARSGPGRSKKWIFQAEADVPFLGKGKVYIDSKGGSKPPASSSKKSYVSRSSAPVQMGAITKQGGAVTLPTARGVVIEQREFLTSVQIPPSVSFYTYSYTVNPGLSSIFTWASRMASQYTKYRLSIEFVYEPTCPSIAKGSITMIFDRNATSPIPDSKAQAFAYENAVSSNVWMPSKYDAVSTTSELYIRTGTLPAGQDQKTYDMGQFIIAITDADLSYATTQDFGNIFINYKLTLLDTKLISNAGDFMVDSSPTFPYPTVLSELQPYYNTPFPYSYLPTSKVYGDADFFIQGAGVSPGVGDDDSAVLIGFPTGGYYRITTTFIGDQSQTYEPISYWTSADPNSLEITTDQYYGQPPNWPSQQVIQYVKVSSPAEPWGGVGTPAIGGWVIIENRSIGLIASMSLNVSIDQVSQTQAGYFKSEWAPLGSEASSRFAHLIEHPIRIGRLIHKKPMSNSSKVDGSKYFVPTTNGSKKEDEQETDEIKIANLEKQLNDLKYKK